MSEILGVIFTVAVILLIIAIIFVIGWWVYKDLKKLRQKNARAEEAHALAEQVMAFDEAKRIMLDHVGQLTQGDPEKFEEALLTVISDQYMPGVGRIPQLISPLSAGSQTDKETA